MARGTLMNDRDPGIATHGEDYAERLIRLQTARWKQWLDVQAPYRWNLRRLDPGSTLDIGCGIGRNLLHLPGSSVGVDVNERCVRAARARGLTAFTLNEFQRSAESNRPGRFDTILLAHVAEHMTEDQVVALLQKLRGAVAAWGQVDLDLAAGSRIQKRCDSRRADGLWAPGPDLRPAGIPAGTSLLVSISPLGWPAVHLQRVRRREQETGRGSRRHCDHQRVNTPLVSAIVVNWNGGAMLRDALASLLAQTWPALEVILVDNGSTDSSVEQAERCFGDKLLVIRNAKNEGFARGNNVGFAAARGEWVFLMDSDAVCDPDVIEELMRFVADKPDVGQLACRVVQADKPHIFDSAGLLLYPDGVSRSRGWQEKDQGQYDRPEEVLAPHGCACALRKLMLDRIGGFDEDFFCYFEDLDLGVRGQLAGWKCWYVPGTRVHHRKSAVVSQFA